MPNLPKEVIYNNTRWCWYEELQTHTWCPNPESDEVSHMNLCRFKGSGFRVQGSRFRVQGSRFRVQGSGFRVQGLEFRV